ncbi:serine/threonine-protein kinase [Euzebya tangerina]|uniref:serine/threonine-protein kinase n=1 Tax=Euzebya tangerina TaxID=591198 RepID=UPI000E3188F0|nr:serine/threonine-protein kinase [Euzebya tangerina]
MTEDTGRLLADRYRLTDAIGRGGMADVYSAEDSRSDRMVAVKVMRLGEAADPDRFASEMEILERLEHPAIVRLFDTGRTEDHSPYFVMQLVTGESLSTRLREEGALPESDITKWAARVAGALAHAHERGVVHRDIKPANILMDQQGRGFLTDFGVARLVDSTLVTKAGTTIGTAAYLAPEQLQDSAVGPPADVYALGLVLIEAFSGRRAFRGSGVEAAMARLGRDPAIPRALPDNWVGLLIAMTRRDPARRPDAAFVEAVLRGRQPPPPLDPVELAARSKVSIDADEAPTEVTPTPTPRREIATGSSEWGPPSTEDRPPAPPTPAAVTPEEPAVAEGGPAKVTRALIAGLVAFVLAMTVLGIGSVALYRAVTDGPIDPIQGNTEVDEATREVVDVIEASETLSAIDPSVQRRLRLLEGELVTAINEDRLDGALDAVVGMTDEVARGIEQLDIDEVAFRSLLESLRELTAAIQAETTQDQTPGE